MRLHVDNMTLQEDGVGHLLPGSDETGEVKFIVMVMDIGWALTDFKLMNWGEFSFRGQSRC